MNILGGTILDKIKKIVTGTLVTGLAMILIPFNSIAYASPLLRMGSRGDEVKQVQQQLSNRSLVKSSHVTGYYGPITYEAVKKFQSQNGLMVDGIVGPATRQKLNLSSSTSRSSSSVVSSGLFKLGTSHPEVSDIQRRLKELGHYKYSRITQYYGPITQEAVKSFQRANGLAVDGIAGPATLRKLGNPSQVSSSSSNAVATTAGLLRLGSRGKEVSNVQRRLKDLGYYKHSAITQYYGPITQSAVREFQRVNGLTADGIVGRATRGKLFDSGAKAAPKNSSIPKRESESSRGNSTDSVVNASNLISFAKKFQGKPYRYGANGPSAFDCSGFTCYVFRNFGISLPRSASAQGNSNIGTKIANRGDLIPGDLVYFTNNRGSNSRPIHHAGIYIGGGNFIHASSSKNGSGVKISTLNSGWYRDGFCWGRRVLR